MDASVVIPAHDKRESLELVLVALERQTFPSDRFEIVVVDDGSTDGTDRLLESFRSGPRLVRVEQPRRGRAAARNAGIRAASGRVIVFTDADAVPAPSFVEAHVLAHEGDGDRVVLGAKYEALHRWVPGMPRSLLRSLREASGPRADLAAALERAAAGQPVVFFTSDDLRASFDVVRAHTLGTSPHNHDDVLALLGREPGSFSVPWILFVTVNVSATRALLDRVGGFDEAFRGWGYEDVELGYRLHAAGARFLYAAGAANHHLAHPVSDARWLEHAENYALFLRKHRSLEVALHWRFVACVLSASVYDALVREHRRALEIGATALADDYLQASWALAQRYCESGATSWKAIRAVYERYALPAASPPA